MEEVHIYHTNDIHSHLENWPSFSRLMPLWRKQSLKGTCSKLYLFDIGDAIDFQHPLIAASQGKVMVKLMNQLGYDAVTLGNNEGLNIKPKDLARAYQQAHFDVIISNLKEKKTGRPPSWAQTLKVYLTPSGHRIAVIALTYPYRPSYNLNGWLVEDPIESLGYQLDAYCQQVDVLILLSHLGIHYDRQIAQQFPQLDIIIGAHTHHLLENGEYEEGVLLAGAGSHGRYVGKITIQLADGQLIYKQAQLRNLKDNQTEADLCRAEQYDQHGQALLDQVHLAHSTQIIRKDDRKESPLSRLAHQAFQDKVDLDVSILFTGLFLTDLGPGIISQNDLHCCLPHPMRLAKIKMQGRDLKDFIFSVEKKRSQLRNMSVQGAGFRGQKLGEFLYKGLHFQAENQEVYWHKKTVEDCLDYEFVTVDFMLFSSLFPQLKEKSQWTLIYPDFIRQVLADYLSNHQLDIEESEGDSGAQ